MFIAKMLVGIIALPACLHAYGQELYGLYLISFGLSASMASFDFGASKSVFRYVVEYREDKDENKFSRALSAGFTFNLISSLLISFIILVLGFNCTTLFKVDSNLQRIAGQLFAIAALNALIITIATVPVNILNANSYFYQRNKMQVIPLVLNIILVIYLYFDKDFPIVVYSSLIVLISLISLILDMYLVNRKSLLKNISVKFIANKSLFTSFNAGYNYKVFLFSLLSFLSVQADKLIIASFFSVSAVTIYAIITKPYFLLKAVLAVSYPVIQPKLSQYNFLSDKNQFSNFSVKIIRSSFYIFLLGIAFLSIFFNQALEIWLGTDEYAQYSLWGVLSMFTLALGVLYSPFSRTLFYTDNISSLLRFSVISVAANIIISIFLTIQMGFPGAILGTATQIILEFFYFNKLAREKMGVNLNTIYTSKLIISSLTILVFSLLLYYLVNQLILSETIILISAMLTFILFIYILFRHIKTENLKTLFMGYDEVPADINASAI